MRRLKKSILIPLYLMISRYFFIPLLKLIAPIFFSKAYLKGRWFEGNDLGWQWVFQSLVTQKIMGWNRSVPWPVTPSTRVAYPGNIFFHPDNLDNFQSVGCYFQASPEGKIVIGEGTYIAQNVGLITSNHDPADLDRNLPGSDIIIGAKCWIGMNCVILPGVVLGDHTIVGAGSVVTKSFPEGHCVIAGSPAKIIKLNA